jgi:acyl carrier protein
MNQSIHTDAVVLLLSEASFINKEVITPETKLKDDLDIDSLELINFIVDLEEKYFLNIGSDDYLAFETVKDITNYLDKKVTNEQTA